MILPINSLLPLSKKILSFFSFINSIKDFFSYNQNIALLQKLSKNLVINDNKIENINNFLVEPYAKAVRDDGVDRRLIFTALHETFITYLKVAFFAAFFLGSPVLLIQIYKFIAPGLYKNEKKALLPYLVFTPILFLFGGLLVYYLIMPIAWDFFVGFNTNIPSQDLSIDLEPKVNKVKWIDRIIVYCIIFALIIGGVLFIYQATLRIFGIFRG